MKVFTYLHTHWDREWYRTFEEFRIRFVEVFDDIIKKLENNEFEQFYLDGQTVVIEDLLDIYPEKEKYIKELISQKKLLIGPWYTLSDEFLVSGESLIRNLFYGLRDAKKFGTTDFCGYLPDAFGHSQGMIDILASFGIQNAVLARGAGELPAVFVWKSKSGAQVNAIHLIGGYFQDALHHNNFDCLKNILEKNLEKSCEDAILLPVGADHLGACDSFHSKLNNLDKNFIIQEGGLFDYLDLDFKNLQVCQNELRDNSCNFILSGTYSSRGQLKRQNTLLTAKIKKIESFLALHPTFDMNVAPILDYTWRLLLQNHAHDSICGCSLDEVHQEMITRNKKISHILDTLENKAITMLEGDSPMCFNTSGFEYSGVVKFYTTKKLKNKGFELVECKKDFPQQILQNIQKIPVSEDLCKIYTYITTVNNLKPLQYQALEPVLSGDLKYSENSIENGYFLLEIDKNCLNLTDKKTGKKYSDFVHFTDVADVGDSYNFSPLVPDKPIMANLSGFKIKNGQHQIILELKHTLKIPAKTTKKRSNKTISHVFLTKIVIENNSPLLKFITKFENKSENHLIQVRFNLEKPILETVSEDSIGTIKRKFNPDYDLQKVASAKPFQELLTNFAPMQRFVRAHDLAIFTKGLHEYEIAQNQLCISLLRCVGMLSGRNLHTRYNPAGPTIPAVEAQSLGEHTVEYAVSFGCDDIDSYKLADKYFEPIITFCGEKSFFKSPSFELNPNLYLLACKKATNMENKLVLRLLNLTNVHQKTSFEGIVANSLEEPLSETPAIIDLAPYELKTCLIDCFLLK